MDEINKSFVISSQPHSPHFLELFSNFFSLQRYKIKFRMIIITMIFIEFPKSITTGEAEKEEKRKVLKKLRKTNSVSVVWALPTLRKNGGEGEGEEGGVPISVRRNSRTFFYDVLTFQIVRIISECALLEKVKTSF